MREAIRRPSLDGVLDGFFKVCLFYHARISCELLAFLLTSKAAGPEMILYPSLNPPRDCAFRGAGLSWRTPEAFLEGFGQKKTRSKRSSKNNQTAQQNGTFIFRILVPTWPQLGPQLGPKSSPKPIQKPSKINLKSHLIF